MKEGESWFSVVEGCEGFAEHCDGLPEFFGGLGVGAVLEGGDEV